mmetsp:Transcript_80306/g.117723  ORF Transcript_80306/g.117723 Transcript_80306/m.117723 type:complete len:251 (-) Transcript_80306:197-949(-)
MCFNKLIEMRTLKTAVPVTKCAETAYTCVCRKRASEGAPSARRIRFHNSTLSSANHSGSLRLRVYTVCCIIVGMWFRKIPSVRAYLYDDPLSRNIPHKCRIFSKMKSAGPGGSVETFVLTILLLPTHGEWPFSSEPLIACHFPTFLPLVANQGCCHLRPALSAQEELSPRLPFPNPPREPSEVARYWQRLRVPEGIPGTHHGTRPQKSLTRRAASARVCSLPAGSDHRCGPSACWSSTGRPGTWQPPLQT